MSSNNRKTAWYKFDDLSIEARKAARMWFSIRNCRSTFGSILSEFNMICSAVGMTLRKEQVETDFGLVEEGERIFFRMDPAAPYSICFEADYAFVPIEFTRSMLSRVSSEHTIREIANSLLAIQKAHANELEARIVLDNELTDRIETKVIVVRVSNEQRRPVSIATANAITKNVRALERWLSNRIQLECRNSDRPIVDEAIRRADMRFTKNGTPVDC